MIIAVANQKGGVGKTTSASNEKLKADILKTDWDLIIIDEAHEGTLTFFYFYKCTKWNKV